MRAWVGKRKEVVCRSERQRRYLDVECGVTFRFRLGQAVMSFAAKHCKALLDGLILNVGLFCHCCILEENGWAGGSFFNEPALHPNPLHVTN